MRSVWSFRARLLLWTQCHTAAQQKMVEKNGTIRYSDFGRCGSKNRWLAQARRGRIIRIKITHRTLAGVSDACLSAVSTWSDLILVLRGSSKFKARCMRLASNCSCSTVRPRLGLTGVHALSCSSTVVVCWPGRPLFRSGKTSRVRRESKSLEGEMRRGGGGRGQRAEGRGQRTRTVTA